MKKKTVFGVALAVVVAVIGIGVTFAILYPKYSQSWIAKQERQARVRFTNQRATYDDLLQLWTTMVPAKCGGAAPGPGMVTLESITISENERLNLEIDNTSLPDLTEDEVAAHFSATPQQIRRLRQGLITVSSDEIFQSGAVVTIVSKNWSSQAVLHVDPMCGEASNYEFWSKSKNGSIEFFRLSSLDEGWYYSVEAR